MNRYKFSEQKKTKVGKRYFGSIMYPEIKIRNNDIYIYAKSEDRIDTLAYKYYGDVSLWWIIARANEGFKGNTRLPINTKLIIPKEIGEILSELERLNSRIE